MVWIFPPKQISIWQLEWWGIVNWHPQHCYIQLIILRPTYHSFDKNVFFPFFFDDHDCSSCAFAIKICRIRLWILCLWKLWLCLIKLLVYESGLKRLLIELEMYVLLLKKWYLWIQDPLWSKFTKPHWGHTRYWQAAVFSPKGFSKLCFDLLVECLHFDPW